MLAKYIDHTLLQPDATRQQIENLCQEAIKYQFYAICIQPYWIPIVRNQYGDQLNICTVVGFPHGSSIKESKAFETQLAVQLGADEIDMVIHLPALFQGEWKYVESDIAEVVKAAQGHLVKVILETALLSTQQIITACQVAKLAGAHFVKTSTGYASSGATTDVVQIMHQTVGGDLGIKASGGIHDRETALSMIDAGATRIGTSNGLNIVSSKG
ncbi:deoxyribose-phosphate aldolase [Seinonella peptonophila]|nr:deoxyribose-phosphate aldolase [Seinonella peptonophila]